MSDNVNCWFDTIVSSIKKQMATWVITIVITILGLLSSYITESVKFALNRADLRTK